MRRVVICENWAVSPERVREFFRRQADVTAEGEGFRFGGCRISLTALETLSFGKWPMTRTELRIEGPETEATVIYRRFYLQFLSAGG